LLEFLAASLKNGSNVERMSKTLILTGPTATGKTGLALEMLRQHDGHIEIINADSMLVYRGMDIGTAKPSATDLREIPHHLVDIRNPDEPFTAGDFYRLVNAALLEIHARGNRALIVGGTSFYLKALLFGLWEGPGTSPEIRSELELFSNEELYSELAGTDSVSATRIGRSDRYRLVRALEIICLSGKTPTELENQIPKAADPRFELWIIDRDGSELEPRILSRTRQMLDDGLIDEVKKLSQDYPRARALNAVGYAEVLRHLRDELPEGRKIKPGLPGLIDEITLSTRQLVKSQRTWFRGFSKRVEARQFVLDRDHSLAITEFQKFYSV